MAEGHHNRAYDLATLMIDTIESYDRDPESPADTLLTRARDAFEEIKGEIILENIETRERTGWVNKPKVGVGHTDAEGRVWIDASVEITQTIPIEEWDRWVGDVERARRVTREKKGARIFWNGFILANREIPGVTAALEHAKALDAMGATVTAGETSNNGSTNEDAPSGTLVSPGVETIGEPDAK